MYIQSISEIANDIAKQSDRILLDQLGELITKGLLEVQYGPLLLTQSPYEDKLQVGRSISLKLKDREYIERLEKKIDTLEQAILKLTEGLRNG